MYLQYVIVNTHTAFDDHYQATLLVPQIYMIRVMFDGVQGHKHQQ